MALRDHLVDDYRQWKRWWRSRMIWLGAHLILAAPVLEYARDHSQLLHAYIGEADGAVSFALGALIVYLRNKTTTPIGKPPKAKGGSAPVSP